MEVAASDAGSARAAAAASAALAPVLTHRHIWGITPMSSPAQLHYLEEGVIVYPCGHNAVRYNVETRVQTLVHGAPNAPGQPVTTGLTALGVTPNRKYVAVAERSDHHGVVNLYDATSLRRRKLLSYPELGSSEVVSVAFSADSKLALTLGGEPEWNLVLWTADRAAKVLTAAKISTKGGPSPRQASFAPHDSTVVCVTGDGVLKFFRIVENQFRPVPLNLKRELQNYTCHTWLLDDRLVIATDAGDVLLFESFEFRCALPGSGNDAIECIAPFSKGFVCGCAGGRLRIFERADDSREHYKASKTFHIEGNPSPIVSIAISPSEDNLVCSTANRQVYTFTLSNADIMKEDSMNFEVLLTQFHEPGPGGSARITAMDTCVWKPLLATCAKDKTIRVWNFVERTVELLKRFDEEPTSVALHPSGLYLVAGFADKLRLMSLLMADIRTIKEISIKACRVCAFSHGGSMFAAVNSTMVVIHNTYTCEQICTLRGHNNKIQCLRWKRGDRELATFGSDGMVFVWNVRTGAKLAEFVQPRTAFNAGVCNADFDRIYGVSSDLSIKELVGTKEPGGATNDLKLGSKATTDATVSCCELSLSSRILFTGSAAVEKPGAIEARVVAPALAQPGHEAEAAQVYQYHSSEVSCLKLSHDGNYLFSGGEDGSLCMFEVHDVNNQGVIRQSEVKEGGVEFTEEILVTKSDLEDKEAEKKQLQNKVVELELNNEYQLRLKDMKYKERIKEVSDKFTAELDADSRRYDGLMESKREMEIEYEGQLRSLEGRHGNELQELESQYDGKIQTEVQRYQTLASDREDEARKWDEENQRLVEEHTTQLKSLTSDYDKKMETEQSKQRELAEEKDTMMTQFNRNKELIEDDADREVEEVKEKFEAKLTAERELTLRLKGENAIMKKKFSALTKDVEDQKEEIRSLQDKETELIETIKGLEKDIQGHKKEIREREETIADKEKRIYDLKKKNQELEKFKFVLDYKIKELKRQIEPRENEIADMRKQVEEMDMELEQYHKSNSALDLMIGELRLKMDGMQREIDAQKGEIGTGAAYIGRFRRELHGVAAHLGDAKKLKTGIRALYAQYVQESSGGLPSLDGKAAKGKKAAGGGGGGGGGDGGDMELQQEYNRQREHLERNVEALRRNIAKDVKMYLDDHARLMRESVVLTQEMNQLRRESHELKRKAKAQNLQLTSGLPPPPPGHGGGSGIPALPPVAGATDAWAAVDDKQAEVDALEAHLQRLRAQEDAGGLPDSRGAGLAPLAA